MKQQLALELEAAGSPTTRRVDLEPPTPGKPTVDAPQLHQGAARGLLCGGCGRGPVEPGKPCGWCGRRAPRAVVGDGGSELRASRGSGRPTGAGQQSQRNSGAPVRRSAPLRR